MPVNAQGLLLVIVGLCRTKSSLRMREQSGVCRGTWARVTMDQFRHLALRNFYEYMVFTRQKISLYVSQRCSICRIPVNRARGTRHHRPSWTRLSPKTVQKHTMRSEFSEPSLESLNGKRQSFTREWSRKFQTHRRVRTVEHRPAALGDEVVEEHGRPQLRVVADRRRERGLDLGGEIAILDERPAQPRARVACISDELIFSRIYGSYMVTLTTTWRLSHR